MSTDDPLLGEATYAFSRYIGLELVGWSEDYARMSLPVEAFLRNRHGAIHGGVHASMLDTVMGYAGCWTGDADQPQMCLTLSLNVQYLSRPLGTVLFAEGRRTGGGKGTFFAEAEIKDDTGELIAKGTGVFRYRKR
ncbi:PaaI family thioesterase [Primorskyibacter flagellatus]|uniref:Uncharacterized domain 1-containing protein n=1 Tax=Primorskyibacter flagellatus TaxID=1387277 RepID=A0A1W2ASF9_9RHOB|nr:PaaI family thioesterase [Primorskyibacter flagellatus]SMC63524.1 uncharacterized domain 1-containing protein [Primorskyibacter flagellatus]